MAGNKYTLSYPASKGEIRIRNILTSAASIWSSRLILILILTLILIRILAIILTLMKLILPKLTVTLILLLIP